MATDGETGSARRVAARGGEAPSAAPGPMRYIICRFCGHENPTGGDACENCGAEFNEGMPESAAAFEGRLLGTPLGTIATANPLWAAPTDSALAAVERMKAEGVDCVLVGDARHLEGLFSDRDAMLRLPGWSGRPPELAQVMSRDPVVLRPEDTVALGIHKMADAGVRHLPLADQTGVVAVVAARDIFRHLATRLEALDGSGGRGGASGGNEPAVDAG